MSNAVSTLSSSLSDRHLGHDGVNLTNIVDTLQPTHEHLGQNEEEEEEDEEQLDGFSRMFKNMTDEERDKV